MIMKPVFNQITIIERKKKTPEYEGNLKEVSATGYMDLNGVTATAKMNQVVLAGGIIEKTNENNFSSAGIQSKLLLGDKFGQVHLMDVSRKIVLDKICIEAIKSRKIINISTATLEWIDTKLTYAAIVARGSPFINIICFKHNENKLYNLYTLNTCPDLENAECLEQNPKQTYTMLPHSAKISLDGEFLSINSFDGRVRIVKMPPIIDPIQNEKVGEAQNTNPSGPGSSNQNFGGAPDVSYNTDEAQGITFSGDLESIQHKDLELSEIQIANIPPMEEDKFEDPYKYKASEESRLEESRPGSVMHSVMDSGLVKPDFKYLLGKEHKKDMEDGDAGCLLKTNKFFPHVDFIRSQFSGRQANSLQHSDVPSQGSSKVMKTYVITTGFLVAYNNSFDVKIYNIQKPSKETCTQDYS